MKYSTGIVSRIAYCRDCKWGCEDFKTATNKAYQHAKRTGHKVTVAVEKATTYNTNR